MRFAELTTYLGQGLRLSMSEDRLLSFIAAVSRDPELASLTGLVAVGDGRRLSVSPGLLAMLAIGALTDQPPSREWVPEVRRHWLALPMIEGIDPTTAIDPFTGQRTLGKALRAIFQRPVLAHRLIRLECCPSLGIWRAFHRTEAGRAGVIAFAAGVPRARALELMASTLSVALPGGLFAELADAISSDARQRRAIAEAVGEEPET